MDSYANSSRTSTSSSVDYNIHHLQMQYDSLNEAYETAKLSLLNETTPQYHVLLNHVRSISKILFTLQRKLKLASTLLKNQLASVEEKIQNYSDQPRERKKPKPIPIFPLTKPNLSFYFQYNGSRCEKDNLDCQQILESGQPLLSQLPSPKRWREYDKRQLYDCVRQSIIKQRSQKLINRLNKVYDLIKSTSNSKKLDILQKCCEKLVDKLSQLKTCSLNELLTSYPDTEFDWQFISERWFRKRFSQHECKMMWELVANPSMGTRWSKATDLLLNSVTNQCKGENWHLICDEVNNGSTPFMCFVRYQSYFKESTRKSAKIYSQSENKLVNEFIDKSGKKDYDFANLVSQFDDIDSKQLKTHINHVVSSKGKTKGTFNAKDKFLINFYAKKGHSCKKISQLVRNRTSKQIYDYQLNSRVESVDRKWTVGEIRKLLTAVKYHGARRWSEISKYLENRSSSSCGHKYRWLKSNYPDLIKLYSKKTPSIEDIKSMLRDRRDVTSARKPHSIDDEIEAYFVEYLEKQPPSSDDIDASSMAKNVLDILKFLNLKVDGNTNQELLSEIGEWLLSFDRSDPVESSSKFDKMFEDLNKSKKDLRITKNARFTHLVPKNCPVLPPNKCTMYGLDTFQKNLQSSCAASGADLPALWSKINSSNKKNKEFIEAKILFYRIFKGLFYWPIKLNSLPLDSFL